MNKSDLVAQLSKQFLNIPEKQIVELATAILEYMSLALAQGKRIEIRNFGSFSLHYHPPRDAHNPKTGKRLTTEAKYIPHFKAGKTLRNQIDQSRVENITIVED